MDVGVDFSKAVPIGETVALRAMMVLQAAGSDQSWRVELAQS